MLTLYVFSHIIEHTRLEVPLRTIYPYVCYKIKNTILRMENSKNEIDQ
jgi:hypothetical protein